MKWQQRVRVATGLSCWQIMLHLLVVAVLVMGWMSGTLVRVGWGYASFTASPCCRCCFYSATMTRAGARWVTCSKSSPPPVLWCGDDCSVAAVTRAAKQPAAGPAGLAILAGPAVVSLLTKEKSYAMLRLNIA